MALLVLQGRVSRPSKSINILHQHQKELEDLINTLDSAYMELELNLIESNGTIKGIFE